LPAETPNIRFWPQSASIELPNIDRYIFKVIIALVRRAPPRLLAFFCLADIWLITLYSAGARRDWPDKTLRFLTERWTVAGLLTFAAAILGILAGILDAALWKRPPSPLRITVFALLGAAGLLLAVLGGTFLAAAQGVL
jgi:hypothetical protein